MMTLTPLTAVHLQAPNIEHGFFTRRGGVSSGLYESLNVGKSSLDQPDKVAENRLRVASYFGLQSSSLATPWQTHSSDVIIIDRPFEGERPKADAVVTSTKNIAIGVLTADCGPILFADSTAMVIGAAHAGWKGALGGVLENTVKAMQRLGAQPENIIAVIGPSISMANYEVGPEFVDLFLGVSPKNLQWFAPSKRAGHSMFDLWGYTFERLQKTGVQAHCIERCTYAEEENFYSYRRSTHRKDESYGQQISALTLKET